MLLSPGIGIVPTSTAASFTASCWLSTGEMSFGHIFVVRNILLSCETCILALNWEMDWVCAVIDWVKMLWTCAKKDGDYLKWCKLIRVVWLKSDLEADLRYLRRNLQKVIYNQGHPSRPKPRRQSPNVVGYVITWNPQISVQFFYTYSTYHMHGLCELPNIFTFLQNSPLQVLFSLFCIIYASELGEIESYLDD